MSTSSLESTQIQSNPESREQVFDAFRRWGYLQTQLDPLRQYLPAESLPELTVTGKFADQARAIYCGTIGAEFMHITDPERRRWIQERMETPANAGDAQRSLDLLIEADIFEQVIQKRYLGTKRFSLEGVTALIPFLDVALNRAGELGAEKVVMAMSHRGRLNVMVNTLGKSAADIFSKFEDADPRSSLGSGDVKYHVGATGIFTTRKGKELALHLVSNPSHLEAVDPVAMGRAFAKQLRYGAEGRERVLPVVIHGDAAFAGQGILAETINLGSLEGYSVGGSIHIIANNLIGFTAEPDEYNSSRFFFRYCAAPARAHFSRQCGGCGCSRPRRRAGRRISLSVPHGCRDRLIGYRRHGHSEVDDPTITQPLRYAKIESHPALYEIFARKLGVDPAERVCQSELKFEQELKQARQMKKKAVLADLPEYWSPYKGGPHHAKYEVDTGISAEEIRKISDGLTAYPKDFHIHPKIKKLLEQRAEMGAASARSITAWRKQLLSGRCSPAGRRYGSAARTASGVPSTSAIVS